MDSNKYKKIEVGIIELAKDILSREIGENIDTIINYSEKFNLSLGTIQKSLTLLSEKNIVKLVKMGKYGTRIEKIDYKKLLNILGYEYLLCVMPITYSSRYKKIMDSISDSFRIPISLYFSHMRGGYVRLKLIEQGVFQFGVVSKLAAQEAITSGLNLEIIEEFGPRTYVTKHVILKRKDGLVRRVGVDLESNDHTFLTNLNFQKNENINFQEIKYSEVIEKLIEKTIDAAIWNYDDVLDKLILLEKNNIVIEELKDEGGISLLATESVIVIPKNNKIMKTLFNKFFDKENFKLMD